MSLSPGIYNTGTATVAANGTTVTFQAAANLQSMVRPGDRFGGHRGLGIRIIAVAETSVTLAAPWPGPAQTAAAYEIVFSPYDLSYRKEFSDIIQRYGRGSLPGLAEIDGALNTLLYGTGANTFATTALTEFARTLLDDANAAAAQQTLGGGALGRQLFAAANAGAARSGLEQDFLTNVSLNAPGSPQDLNLAINNGFYRVNGETLNTPDGSGPSGSTCLVINWGTGTCLQIFFRRVNAATFRVYFRAQHTAGVWTEWSRVYHALDAFSVVSQSGGIATGGLMETGNNANGYYERHADGTVECWGRVTVPRQNASVLQYLWTLPVAMLNDASRIATITMPYANADHTNITQSFGVIPTVNHNNTNVALGLYAPEGKTIPTGAEIRNVNIHAKGRWF